MEENSASFIDDNNVVNGKGLGLPVIEPVATSTDPEQHQPHIIAQILLHGCIIYPYYQQALSSLGIKASKNNHNKSGFLF